MLYWFFYLSRAQCYFITCDLSYIIRRKIGISSCDKNIKDKETGLKNPVDNVSFYILLLTIIPNLQAKRISTIIFVIYFSQD